MNRIMPAAVARSFLYSLAAYGLAQLLVSAQIAPPSLSKPIVFMMLFFGLLFNNIWRNYKSISG
jgi:hypothetical protein